MSPLFLAAALAGANTLAQVQPPLQLVRVNGLWFGKFEVTQSQYQSFVKASGYTGAAFPSSKTSEPYLNDWKNGKPAKGKGMYPVCNLNWHHAKAFCEWLAKASGRPVRLPSDAEWTLAAAGREGRTYPWGNTFSIKRCNSQTAEDGYSEAAPVGSFPSGATPEGLMDMAGNIWEWSAEGHLRGGPWCMKAPALTCSEAAAEDPERCDDKFGLRVVVAD